MRLTLLTTLLGCLVATAGFTAEDDEVVVGPITVNPQDQIQRFGMANFDQMLLFF